MEKKILLKKRGLNDRQQIQLSCGMLNSLGLLDLSCKKSFFCQLNNYKSIDRETVISDFHIAFNFYTNSS